MPVIKYIEHCGHEREVVVPVGWSVMEGAVKNMVPGVVAECGGVCACATCHVYVRLDWLARLPPRSDNEDAILEYVDGRRENSRLACQIKVNLELDGLVVQTPANQT